MKTTFFKGCTCIEDAKQLYKEFCLKWHPDVSKEKNATETMQEINAEWENVFAKLKDVHKNAKGETYTAKESTSETFDEYRDILEKIIHFQGVKIEIIGTWVWVSGDTKPYKDTLKEMKFRWSPNKTAWAWHRDPYKKKSKNKFDMNGLRNMWGFEEIETQPLAGIA